MDMDTYIYVFILLVQIIILSFAILLLLSLTFTCNLCDILVKWLKLSISYSEQGNVTGNISDRGTMRNTWASVVEVLRVDMISPLVFLVSSDLLDKPC